MKVKFLFFFFLSSIFKVYGQVLTNSQKDLELGTFISPNPTLPFWSRANQYGIVPLNGNILTFRGGILNENIPVFKKLKKMNLGYGLRGVINVGRTNQIILPEAFLKVKFGVFEFYGGRRKEIVGLVDSSFSSGSLIWSGNALPMPKIQISIPQYTPIIGKGLISIKGSYSHGWFDNNKLLNSYLHQKSFYGRIGKPNWKLKFYGGFNHQVQWGGTINVPYPFPTVMNNKIPSTLTDYVYVVSGISLNYTSRQQQLNSSQYTSYDLTNRVGNHIGTIDIGTELNLKNLNIFIYRQSIYDDGSLFYLANITDGLQGLSISFKEQKRVISFNKIIFEYLNTTSQGSIVGPESPIPAIRGRDNYFNHGQFINGWAYKDLTIGTPFIMPAKDIKDAFPKYTIDVPPYFPEYFTKNNRVQSFYLGTQMTILNKYHYKFRVSHSRNFGTYDLPLQKNQKAVLQTSTENSFSTEIKNRKFGQAQLTIRWANDRGQLLYNTNSIFGSLKKTFK